MIDTGVYFPIRVFDGKADDPELTFNRFECENFTHEEYFHCPLNRLLPFQVQGQVQLTPGYLVDMCTGDGTQISLNMASDDVNGRSWESHMGTDLSGFAPGLYSFRGSMAPGHHYSDPFYLSADVSQMVHLKYRDKGVKGSFLWREGLWAECYIDTIIEKPTYPIHEEAERTQDNEMHRLFQRWEKRHMITFKGVESMADAMSVLPVMDEVYVNGQRVFDVMVDITWDDEYSCLALIEISFLRHKLIKTF